MKKFVLMAILFFTVCSLQAENMEASCHRNEQSVRQTLDNNKAAIYILYIRALRDSPGLQGKVSIDFSIDQDGKVIYANTTSAEINDSNLLGQINERFKVVDFGVTDCAKVETTRWTIELLPKP